MVGFPAFSEAKEDNDWYKMIWDQDFTKFWESVEKYRPLGSIALSPEFQSLIQGLICKDPKKRLEMKQVLAHPWVTDSGRLEETKI